METPVGKHSYVRRLADNPGEALLRAEAELVDRENAELRDRYHRLTTLEEEQQDGRGVSRRRFIVGTDSYPLTSSLRSGEDPSPLLPARQITGN